MHKGQVGCGTDQAKPQHVLAHTKTGLTVGLGACRGLTADHISKAVASASVCEDQACDGLGWAGLG